MAVLVAAVVSALVMATRGKPKLAEPRAAQGNVRTYAPAKLSVNKQSVLGGATHAYGQAIALVFLHLSALRCPLSDRPV
jgi:hypothetical protein